MHLFLHKYIYIHPNIEKEKNEQNYTFNLTKIFKETGEII